jgi:hypothetical protein
VPHSLSEVIWHDRTGPAAPEPLTLGKSGIRACFSPAPRRILITEGCQDEADEPGPALRTSIPVTDLAMIVLWTSLVPSKMVKILAIGAVYAGQRPAAPRGISTDSARPVRDEFRFWVGPVRGWRAGRRRASAGGRGRPVSWRTPSAGCSATGTSQVHSCADLRLSRRSRYRPRVRGADRPDAGRTPGECPEPRAGRCHADTAASPAGRAIHASAGD